MSYEALALLCLIAALVLLVAEFFLPTGGIVGILCLVSLVISVWSAKQAWYGVRPGLWYAYLLTLVVAIPGSIYGLFRYLQSSEYGENVFLSGPDIDDVTPYADETRHLDDLLGRIGTAETDLMPSGVCRIDGERMDCTSNGPMIAAGVRVTVVGRRGAATLVRAATPAELDPARRLQDPEPAAETDMAADAGDSDAGDSDPDFGVDDHGERPLDPFA